MTVLGLGALVGLASIALLVWALVDLVRRPADVWEAAGHNQLVWVLIVVLIGFVGPLLYLLVARPALDAITWHDVPADRLGAR